MRGRGTSEHQPCGAAPFRLLVKGKFVNVQEPVLKEDGSILWRDFYIMDDAGVWLSCCAMTHNAESSALQNFHKVLLYYCLGSRAFGGKGRLYLLKDALIVGFGRSKSEAVKIEELCIEWPVVVPYYT